MRKIHLFIFGLMLVTTLAQAQSQKNNEKETEKAQNIAIEETIKEPEKTTEDAFYMVETNAKFNNGDFSEFVKWVNKNKKYPEEVIKNKISGKVTVQFIVDTLGQVVKPTILRGVSEELDKEVIRVMKLSPTWEPGRLQGKKVRQFVIIPIKFELPENNVKP